MTFSQKTADDLANIAEICLVEVDKVAIYTQYFDIFLITSTIFFFNGQHIKVDWGTPDHTKFIGSFKHKQDFIGVVEPDWSQLPNEILLQVFSYLSNSDKYHAALTCKSWLRPLSVPSLWQSGDFVFDCKSDEKAIRFVDITGKTLRHIKVECKKLENLQLVLEYHPSCSEKMYLFLASLLNSENHQLLTFRLKNLSSLETYCGGERSTPLSEVAKLLKRFLKVQRQLRVLDLSNSEKSVRFCFKEILTVRQGMKLLIAAGKYCGTTLHTLAIARLVSLKSSFHNSMSYLPQFRNAISGFSKLSDLDLSYGYLEDDLLLSLANTTTSLKLITVRADEIPELESQITALAWEKLTAACPELKAIFHIKHKFESYSQDPTLILTPSMPLYQVKWKAGAAIAKENLEKFFQHVAQNFQNTIHHLHLQTGVRPDTERFELVFKSLQACKNLDTLSLCLKSYKSGDVEMYMLAIKDVMTRCPVSCDVTLNGQVVKVGSGEFTGLTS
ncbi:F-box only protein 39-like [Physella acuta]|uniref:F-box only protein 39-like n=1 Tax=Physella acuta TaxID=109671 RepID=UPI0027DDB1CE|nr:F-box only protein 39-like [Physella acuta]